MNLINKIIDWFNSDKEESIDYTKDIVFDNKYLNSKPIKKLDLKRLAKKPEKIFEFDYNLIGSTSSLFKIFDKITIFGYERGNLVNGIVKPSNGISKIELIHFYTTEILEYTYVKRDVHIYKLDIDPIHKLKIEDTYKIDCVIFDSPIYPISNTGVRVYDKDNKKYENITLISTISHMINRHELLNNYRIYEKRTFENDRLLITEIRPFSTQYKSKSINLKPIKRLFQKRYKNKRKILSKYLCKNVIGIICSY